MIPVGRLATIRKYPQLRSPTVDHHDGPLDHFQHRQLLSYPPQAAQQAAAYLEQLALERAP